MVPESSMRQRVVARQAVDGQAARPMLARGHHGAEAEAIGRNLAPLESALAVVKESQHNGEGMPIEIHAVLVPAQKLSIPVVQDVTEAHLHMLVAEGPQQKICGREDLRAAARYLDQSSGFALGPSEILSGFPARCQTASGQAKRRASASWQYSSGEYGKSTNTRKASSAVAMRSGEGNPGQQRRPCCGSPEAEPGVEAEVDPEADDHDAAKRSGERDFAAAVTHPCSL
eukprot:CAMPEP_0177376602 /NCGR_PEP_ID=MMETSP0368-20130122/45320_1 /TAXON_ID=447022 ORGANISM="Scrippsiella hangoei-like, Strain SHHI-4" /NCGR_SAMPLE_ID=MMETSP0368 /ASSEMBLY_ACC=CAM_ASM_000363 /LENGTH=228 /DNA_ID=CAMNT_0018840359 /DNA_START=184 /DNA_END=869 /DNA_ORIENTATION=+